ncbi:hypothetical protein GCK32_006463, partial [Trichostrongylus colubriformis]
VVREYHLKDDDREVRDFVHLQSELFRVLVAIAKLGAANESRKGAAEEAKRALAAAEKFGIIRPTDRELYERTNKVSTIPEE